MQPVRKNNEANNATPPRLDSQLLRPVGKNGQTVSNGPPLTIL